MTLLVINWGNALDIVFFGMGLVFLLLIVLVIVLNLFSRLIAPTVKFPKLPHLTDKKETASADDEYVEGHLSANDSAAIAMAIHLYYFAEVHDVENAVVTIKQVQRRYSPWSSKIYGLNNLVK